MKKLEWAANKLKSLGVKSGEDLEILSKYGFKKKYLSKIDATCGHIFIHRRRGIVIKNNYQPNKYTPRFGNKYIIETIKYTKKDSDSFLISIQPYCKPFKSWRAKSKAIDFLYSKPWLRKADIHDGNIRLYRGKPVLIDW